MTIRADGRKKSEFVAKDTVQAGGYLDYVVNGTNYKISYDNFVANLGVTGSIVQTGAVTGAPVLEVDGPVKRIRNMEDGSGISVNVSATNGLVVSHNFTANADGLPILLNTTAASPTIASIVAGSGISVTAVNTNGIQITSIADQIYSQVTMQGNSTATTISTQGTAVKVAGTWVVQTESNFTGNTTGRLTYTGSTTEVVSANVSITFSHAGSGTDDLAVYIAKNGSVLTASKLTRAVTGNSRGNVGTFFNVSMATSDYLEVFVANDSDTSNITVVDCLFGVS
tara:strand:+ start:340 stop:1188 length:849 start_codon:yes stop_codon:yes gene_type:complete